jgi:hypothetical protein
MRPKLQEVKSQFLDPNGRLRVDANGAKDRETAPGQPEDCGPSDASSQAEKWRPPIKNRLMATECIRALIAAGARTSAT